MQGAADVQRRVTRLDWERIEADLDERGVARARSLLSAAECRALASLWEDDERFRSRIEMEPRRFGVGEYKYFARPLPPIVETLRRALYAGLAPLASRWSKQLGGRAYPPSLEGFLARCSARGQVRPTPLLLRYETGGYNRLHQDRYGELAFPLQVALLLSRPEHDFRGGEFLLVEQRPRMQSRGEAVALEQGEAVFFPNAERPVRGARGVQRAQVRHGASRLHAGTRLVLGIIFHDAL